jgi:hypothetical protein
VNLRTSYKSAQLLDDLQSCVAEHFPGQHRTLDLTVRASPSQPA